MERFGKIKTTALVLLCLFTSWAVIPDPADAGPEGRSSAVSDSGSKLDSTGDPPRKSRHKEQERPGLKGFALSLDGDSGDHRLRIKTAFLVKPLKTDNFFVAFATAAPLLDHSTSKADSHIVQQPNGHSDDAQSLRFSQNPNEASEWMVIADLPRASMLNSGTSHRIFNWMPELDGDSSWHSKVEFIFLPADQWTVRAILSMAHDAPEDRQYLSSRETHATRIGMGIDVDYQILKSMALGIDYDHYRYGGLFPPGQADANLATNGSDSNGSNRGESIAARLTIRF